MEVKVTIQSKELSKEELQQLIQGIRDCEQKAFPEKEIRIWIEVPELTSAECNQILASIKPPYKHGPITLDLRRRYPMVREPALSGTDLDGDRELCRQGCREWIRWYQDKKGKTVYGCRLGLIPEMRTGQWYCRQHKSRRQKGGEDHVQGGN